MPPKQQIHKVQTAQSAQHICFDHARSARIGLPEAVFCQGKDPKIIQELLTEFNKKNETSILFTRLEEKVFHSFPKEVQKGIDYHPLSRTAFSRPLAVHTSDKKVAIISAGSADASVVWEAARTLEYLGIQHNIFEDCGVAGLWRILERLEEIQKHHIIIAVAGLDAALISVLGGLVDKPIFAVPTSVGYGMSKNGESALSSMLVSCAQGIPVMNIDNGYGAACAAARVLNMIQNSGK